MESAPGTSLDLAAAKRLAGERVFARGESYYRQGYVDLVGVEEGRAVARVLGSEVYAVEITVRARGFQGNCTCPAFADTGLCKHMIAVALAVNDLDRDGRAVATSRLAAIRQRLERMPRGQLEALALRMALADDEMLAYLEGEGDAD